MTNAPKPDTNAALPLAGVRVIEFSHMVMGPTCGLILADLGAEVIKVEPRASGDRSGERTGDPTRYLTSTGAGFFAAFSRNKKSVTLDLATPEDLRLARTLIACADVLIENFRPGGLDEKGLDYATLNTANPRLIYCSLKGFLSGPYANRTALDEVVQMMTGLAYMTGLPGRPLRAGAPVNDMMGGLFGALAILAALRARDTTGVGQHVHSGLFENSAWLMSTHMMQYAVSGKVPEPMSAGKRAWGVYDVFTCADGEQLFIGVVTERQWALFTERLGDAALADPAYASNTLRANARATLIPLVAQLLLKQSSQALEALCAQAGLPYARIVNPVALFDDVHLQAGGLVPVTLPNGVATHVPGLPIQFGASRLGTRLDLPKPGEHNAEILDPLR